MGTPLAGSNSGTVPVLDLRTDDQGYGFADGSVDPKRVHRGRFDVPVEGLEQRWSVLDPEHSGEDAIVPTIVPVSLRAHLALLGPFCVTVLLQLVQADRTDGVQRDRRPVPFGVVREVHDVDPWNRSR